VYASIKDGKALSMHADYMSAYAQSVKDGGSVALCDECGPNGEDIKCYPLASQYYYLPARLSDYSIAELCDTEKLIILAAEWGWDIGDLLAACKPANLTVFCDKML
jgi:hypothetical protein